MKYEGVVSIWGLPAALIIYHDKISPPKEILELCDTTSSLHITILSQYTLGIDFQCTHDK